MDRLTKEVQVTFADKDKDFITFDTGKPRVCETCVLQDGPAPWADHPSKAYCIVYPREAGIEKPAGICYDGEGCEFYIEREAE